MSKALRIFLVDDHRMLRDGLVGYFDNALKYEIVGEAGDGAEARGGERLARFIVRHGTG